MSSTEFFISLSFWLNLIAAVMYLGYLFVSNFPRERNPMSVGQCSAYLILSMAWAGWAAYLLWY